MPSILDLALVCGILGLALWLPRRLPDTRLFAGLAIVGRTWAVAEVLALVWLPPPGDPPMVVIDEGPIGHGMVVPGSIGEPPGPSDDRLVLVVGDSFAQGQGAPADQSMPAHLQRGLAADGVRVRNHGARGSEFPDQLVRVALMDRELSPDVVVWSFTLNDLELGYEGRDAISVRGELTARGPTPLLAALRRTGTAWWTREAMEDDYTALYDPDGAPWSGFEQGFRRVVASQQDRGARVVFVIWPLLYRLDAYPFRAIHAQLARAAEDAGAEVVDLLEVFEGMDERTLWAHPTDHHPNAQGYGMGARAVLAAIEAAPFPDSARWGPGAKPWLDPPYDGLERRWAEDPTADTLRANAIALWDLHAEAFARNTHHPMVGRVPPLMLASAWLRRPAGSAEAEADLALLRTWGFAAP